MTYTFFGGPLCGLSFPESTATKDLEAVACLPAGNLYLPAHREDGHVRFEHTFHWPELEAGTKLLCLET